LDPRKDYHHWRVINVLNNRCNQQNNGPTSNAITSDGYTSTTDRQAANLLAQHYEQASRLSFSREDRKQKKIYRQVLNQSKSYNQRDDISNDITLEELDSVIRSLDPKKSSGIDLIFGSMIKHFGVLARSILLQIFNLSWITGKLPTIWKMSVIVPILKPGKDAASCKNFRPISLTSTLCKIMEKIIHSRIMKWLIKRKVLHFYQTAYRSQHSTVDQIFYLVQSIIDGFQE
ncbi:reverse transcriptase domain-containing protein, partial [Trichonephila clavata]